MNIFRAFVLLLLVALALQGAPVQAQQFAFEVCFTDKNHSPYSLSTPLAYLSPRALARRSAQGIAVDSTDLPVNPAYVDSVLSLTGGVFHESSRWLNRCMILLSDSSQILRLAGKPFISAVHLVGYFDPSLHARLARAAPAPSARATTSFDAAYYGYTWQQTQAVNGNFLHQDGFMGQGKLIAVLDAGFVNANSLPGFDSLWAGGRVVDTFNFTFHNTNVFMQDDHGEQVLSTLAGYVPGAFVGSAPLASYALYLTEYDPDDQPLEMDNLLCATERADSIGADVVSISLGYDLFYYPPGAGQNFDSLNGYTTVAAKAANIATKKGMLFVATAGNDGDGYMLNGVSWGDHIMTPGDADSALTIGAIDDAGVPAPWSGYGPNAAGRVKPDVTTLGDPASVISSAGYTTGGGTSFSTPQIAGWAACLWQANPWFTPYALREAIIQCAASYSTPGAQIGYGVPDFECAYSALNIKKVQAPGSPRDWAIALPNPCYDQLQLYLSPVASGDIRFSLFTIEGTQLAQWHQYFYKGNNPPVEVPVANLPPGLYIIKVVSASQQQVVRVVKD